MLYDGNVIFTYGSYEGEYFAAGLSPSRACEEMTIPEVKKEVVRLAKEELNIDIEEKDVRWISEVIPS